MEEKEMRKLAKVRASFKVHLMVYLIVIVFLAWANYSITPGYLWFLWVAFGWGVGLLLHALSAYVWKTDLEEKEYQKIKEKEKKKKGR